LFFVFVFFTVFVFFFVGFLLFLLRNYIQHEYSDYLPTTLTKLECCSWISHALRTIALTNRTTPIIALHTHAVIRMTPLWSRRFCVFLMIQMKIILNDTPIRENIRCTQNIIDLIFPDDSVIMARWNWMISRNIYSEVVIMNDAL
jgi:hypothetical protein